MKEDIVELASHAWDTAQAHLKVYAPISDQPIVTLRIYAGDSAQVAKVKASLERMLSGTTAANGVEMLWHEIFDRRSSLPYLALLHHQNGGFIVRDLRERKVASLGNPAID